MVWPAIIAAGAALAGAYAQKESSEKIAEKMQRSQTDQATLNYRQQKEFAQMGIRWRVADAKKAGLHPLAAIGMQGASFSPSSMSYPMEEPTDYGLSAAGQSFQRAMYAKQTHTEREMARLDVEFAQERVNNMRLQNMGLLTRLNNLDSVPAMPAVGPSALEKEWGIAGQDDAGVRVETSASPIIRYTPSEVVIKEQPGYDAGYPALEQFYQRPDGGLEALPSTKASEPLESAPVSSVKYGLGKLWDQARGLWYSIPSEEGSQHFNDRQDFEEYLYKIRPRSKDPDYEYRFNPLTGAFYREYITGPESSLIWVQGKW